MKRVVLRVCVMFLGVTGVIWGTVIKSPEIQVRVWLLRTDSQGDTLWTRLYGEGRYDYKLTFAMQTSDGGYVIAGNFGYFSEFWLLKTDETGDIEWWRTYKSPIGNYSASCIVETCCGYIVEAPREYNEDRTQSYPRWFVEVDSVGEVISFNNDSTITQPLSKENPYPGHKLMYPTKDGALSFGFAYEDFDSTRYCHNCVTLVKYEWTNQGNELEEVWTRIYRLWDWVDAKFINQSADGGFIVLARVERRE